MKKIYFFHLSFFACSGLDLQGGGLCFGDEKLTLAQCATAKYPF